MLRIAGIVKESVVDGEGFRYTVFTQGCPHHCEGCHNPQTWDFAAGKEIDEAEIIADLSKNPLLQGVTFSGGEPFMQPDPLGRIADASHAMGLDVWSWTGFRFEDLIGWTGENKAAEARLALLEKVDVLVDGRFELDKRNLGLMFRGSSNQRVIDVQESLARGEVVIWPGLKDDT